MYHSFSLNRIRGIAVTITLNKGYGCNHNPLKWVVNSLKKIE